MKGTIYNNIFDKTGGEIKHIDELLERIKSGCSREKVERIRATIDKDKANELKKYLPSVCFSGEFSERKDGSLIRHSGFICLDFDNVNIEETITDLVNRDFIYACWVSPSGTGVKALARIADGNKHREHFHALQEVFPNVDASGINVSRVCYESYDPNIYINENAKPFCGLKSFERVEVREFVSDYKDVFNNLLKWLSNRGDAFERGNRNRFIFKLASACCRYGIPQAQTEALINITFQLNQSGFSVREGERTIQSAYKSNESHFGQAVFEKGVLVDKINRSEVDLKKQVEDYYRLKDVIYGIEVKEDALKIFNNGYERLEGIGMPFDNHWKPKKGELTLLTGIGNYGKSTFDNWYKINRAVLYGDKFGIFSPENYPAHEYYHELVEILLGCDCGPNNPNRPSRRAYTQAYDYVSNHFFYVYPRDVESSPDYILDKFLELIVKEGCNWFTIDPFNQLANDYGSTGGRSDKYLEKILSRFSRFSQENNAYMNIVAHPKLMPKQSDGNYQEPDIFDIADGAMWNNKMDNILVYHRPLAQTDPNNPLCTITSKKIRRQKVVGLKGCSEMAYLLKHRRYFYYRGPEDLADVLGENLEKAGIDFGK